MRREDRGAPRRGRPHGRGSASRAGPVPPTLAAPLLPPGRPSLDNLTHSLVGAALARAGADRATPLATATLVVAANAPDVDVLSYARGEYAALAFRRGITHGVPALLLLPLLVAGAVLAWDRLVRRRRRPDAAPARAGPVLLLAYLGTATHPALDWLNNYGMRWWLPLDGSWSYGDAVFIVDPWLWLGLGGAVFLAGRARGRALAGWAGLALATTALVLGSGRLPGLPTALLWLGGLAALVLLRVRGAGGPRATRVVLAAAGAYVGALALTDLGEARLVTGAARSAGLEPVAVMVAPEPADPFTSTVEVRTPEAYVPGTFHWLARPRVRLRPADAVPLLDAPAGLDAAAREAILTAARAEPRARDWLVWARLPYVRIRPDGDGWRVRFTDARYDRQRGVGGLAGVEVRVPAP